MIVHEASRSGVTKSKQRFCKQSGPNIRNPMAQ
jgi:hypothetical protein